ncbi:MAG: hypothetical protein FJ315_04030, partial [SAR202 cluster bacterium]|nr:hypothetical protein [SAR202 cluster bacterium]
MPEVLLFAEDAGFAAVLNALIQRIAREAGGEVVPKSLVARRGYERVKRELREFIREVNRGYQPAPALLVVGVDANCKGAQ